MFLFCFLKAVERGFLIWEDKSPSRVRKTWGSDPGGWGHELRVLPAFLPGVPDGQVWSPGVPPQCAALWGQ